MIRSMIRARKVWQYFNYEFHNPLWNRSLCTPDRLAQAFCSARLVTAPWTWHINTLRPRQDGRHFADDIFTCIFFKNWCILNTFSLKYVRKGPIDNNPALVQKMAWRRSGDKPLSEPMMISLPTHICVTRPQWVKNQYLTHCGLTRSHIVISTSWEVEWLLNKSKTLSSVQYWSWGRPSIEESNGHYIKQS